MPSIRSGSSGTLLTLDRGICVLEEIARGNGLGTARSIGATLGINQGTVYQILRTLQDSGYVRRHPAVATNWAPGSPTWSTATRSRPLRRR